jgi:hypothetical protein
MVGPRNRGDHGAEEKNPTSAANRNPSVIIGNYNKDYQQNAYTIYGNPGSSEWPMFLYVIRSYQLELKSSCYLYHVDPEDGGRMFIRDVG